MTKCETLNIVAELDRNEYGFYVSWNGGVLSQETKEVAMLSIQHANVVAARCEVIERHPFPYVEVWLTSKPV